jgi:hypothetical protein
MPGEDEPRIAQISLIKKVRTEAGEIREIRVIRGQVLNLEPNLVATTVSHHNFHL